MVVHLLNDCGTDRSSLHDEGLGAFFMDIHRPEAQIVVPSERVQARLVHVLESDLAAKLHESRYNMVSFPFNPKYQNSTRWLHEVFAAANATDVAITSRQQAVDWQRNCFTADFTSSTWSKRRGTERVDGFMFIIVGHTLQTPKRTAMLDLAVRGNRTSRTTPSLVFLKHGRAHVAIESRNGMRRID